MKEGLFLEETGLSPYAGTAFHQPPLILTIFKLPVYINLTSFFVILLDLWTAYLLFHITKLYNQSKEAKTDRFSDPPASMPHMVALLCVFVIFWNLFFFYLSPFSSFLVICIFLFHGYHLLHNLLVLLRILQYFSHYIML